MLCTPFERGGSVREPGRILINRFARAVETYESEAVVQRHAAARLADLMGQHFHVLGGRILEIGCGTGMLSRRLLTRFAPAELVLNDLCPDVGVCFSNVPRTRFLPGDAREVVWPGTFDAIASASALQWFGDLTAFASRCAAVLPKDGILAVSCFGPATLRETAALTGCGLTYPGFDAFRAALETAFDCCACERTVETLVFPDAAAVLRHLKATGVTATGASGGPWTRGRMAEFAAAYASRFPAASGGVTVTYEPYWFVGKKR